MNAENNSNAQSPFSSVTEPPKMPVQELPSPKNSSGIGKIILIAFLSITTLIFAGLFVWKLLDWQAASTNLQAQIDDAVAAAVLETETEMDAKFAEEQKNPYQTFLGPSDYGSLSFSYPKTWSLYISADASKGGTYTAFMNPTEIPPINSNSTILALRITIKDQDFDSIVKTYNNYLKNGKMTMDVVNVNNGNSTANVYRGALQNPSKASGIVAIMKIRDKTAILQTDSTLFEGDFNKVLSTLVFNS